LAFATSTNRFLRAEAQRNHLFRRRALLRNAVIMDRSANAVAPSAADPLLPVGAGSGRLLLDSKAAHELFSVPTFRGDRERFRIARAVPLFVPTREDNRSIWTNVCRCRHHASHAGDRPRCTTNAGVSCEMDAIIAIARRHDL